jgi:uncharacterized UPF0146 family protein
VTNKIKIKCINTGGYHLTRNKIYLATKVEIPNTLTSKLTPNNTIVSYKLINDKGVEFYSEIENFITIDEWRESQLNKII